MCIFQKQKMLCLNGLIFNFFLILFKCVCVRVRARVCVRHSFGGQRVLGAGLSSATSQVERTWKRLRPSEKRAEKFDKEVLQLNVCCVFHLANFQN